MAEPSCWDTQKIEEVTGAEEKTKKLRVCEKVEDSGEDLT